MSELPEKFLKKIIATISDLKKYGKTNLLSVLFCLFNELIETRDSYNASAIEVADNKQTYLPAKYLSPCKRVILSEFGDDSAANDLLRMAKKNEDVDYHWKIMPDGIICEGLKGSRDFGNRAIGQCGIFGHWYGTRCVALPTFYTEEAWCSALLVVLIYMTQWNLDIRGKNVYDRSGVDAASIQKFNLELKEELPNIVFHRDLRHYNKSLRGPDNRPCSQYNYMAFVDSVEALKTFIEQQLA